MSTKRQITIDGNEAAASVAYRINEVIAIFPITPGSPMGELCDEWSARSQNNLWGAIPQVVEMQSEGGAAGAVHGALQAGALTTTFTASQGLLLMIPNMYKIAGELTPSVFMWRRVRWPPTACRSLVTTPTSWPAGRPALPSRFKFGPRGARLAAIAQAATLESRVPFLHFFDGFRTSHEIGKSKSSPTTISAGYFRRGCPCAPRSALYPGPARAPGDGAEPRRLLPGARSCQPVLRRLSRHRRAAMDSLRCYGPDAISTSLTT